jgi:hypothetical protein
MFIAEKYGGTESTAKWLDENEKTSEYQIINKEVIQDIKTSVNTEPKAEKGKGTRDETTDTYNISEVRDDLNSCANVNTVTLNKKMQSCSMKTVIHRQEQKFVQLS